MIDETKLLLLDIVRYRLFNGEKPNIKNRDLVKLLDEALGQTVYTMAFPVVEDELKKTAPERFNELSEKYLAKLIVNTGNYHDHGELDRVMRENDIPYVIIKGIASAYYYPDSSLRDMGDVDLLVSGDDFKRAEEAAETLGYKYNHGGSGDFHVAYERKGLSILEIHRSVNGIPENAVGARINEEIKSAVKNAREINFASVRCMITDEFCHGLVMLLHTASHMTREGIGLRHLLDWAVFVNSFSGEDFRKLFETKLRDFGLWKFCCVLTKVCEEYLGIDEKKFADDEEISRGLTEAVLNDILGGGNFGFKDKNRYREIKYISDRNDNSVSERGMASQLLSSLNAKVKDNKLVKKSKAFYPLGLILESGKYLGLIITGKRKSSGTSDMLKEASERKRIYKELELFKN